MNYKAELTIPMEMYGNIKPQVEGTPEEIVAAYNSFIQARAPKPVNEMPEAEFTKIYDTVGNGQAIADDPGVLQMMSPVQQRSLNDLKKFIKRVDYKASKTA